MEKNNLESFLNEEIEIAKQLIELFNYKLGSITYPVNKRNKNNHIIRAEYPIYRNQEQVGTIDLVDKIVISEVGPSKKVTILNYDLNDYPLLKIDFGYIIGDKKPLEYTFMKNNIEYNGSVNLKKTEISFENQNWKNVLEINDDILYYKVLLPNDTLELKIEFREQGKIEKILIGKKSVFNYNFNVNEDRINLKRRVKDNYVAYTILTELKEELKILYDLFGADVIEFLLKKRGIEYDGELKEFCDSDIKIVDNQKRKN